LQQVYSYENALLASRGFVLSSNTVNRSEWQSFVSALRLSERRRGMLGIGYTDFVQAQDIPEYEASIRQEGFPKFQVWPRSPARELYTSIRYIEPFDATNRPALGYDMYSDEARR